MKKRYGVRRIKRIGRIRARRGLSRRVKIRTAHRSAKRSAGSRSRRTVSAKKRARLEAADMLLILCLFALMGGIALFLYLHYAKGLNF